MRSEDYGKHLLDVENLLHKHSLVESQIQSQGESVQRINNIAQRFIKAKHPESRVIKERQALLNQAFEVQSHLFIINCKLLLLLLGYITVHWSIPYQEVVS